MEMNHVELMERLRNLAELPVVDVPPSEVARIQKRFTEQFPKSKNLAEQYKKCIPGGNEHQNAIKWPFTITMARGEGPYLWDVDGNQYVDYLMASGPVILGHNFPEVRDHVISTIKEKGPALGVMCEEELLAARAIAKHFDSIDMVRFYQSGTEVGMAAARLARTFTGKEYIIKAGGSYHGWSDQLVYDLHLPGSANMFAYGIPGGCYEKTLSFKPGDSRRLAKLVKRHEKEGKGGVAAIFLEGGGGDGMTWHVPAEFYKEVREICDDHGILLIMDEVITGFRLAMGGAQEYYNVKADLTMLGKIIAHQYPSAGALGGREDVMELLGTQAEEVSEDGQSIKKSVMTAGTLAGTTITCAATAKTIECIEKYDAINVTARAASKITRGINETFEDHGLPFFAYNFNSIMHVPTSNFYHVSLNRPDSLEQVDKRRELLAQYNAMLVLEGVHSLQAMRMYTCLGHDTKEAQERTIRGFDAFCSRLKR